MRLIITMSHTKYLLYKIQTTTQQNNSGGCYKVHGMYMAFGLDIIFYVTSDKKFGLYIIFRLLMALRSNNSATFTHDYLSKNVVKQSKNKASDIFPVHNSTRFTRKKGQKIKPFYDWQYTKRLQYYIVEPNYNVQCLNLLMSQFLAQYTQYVVQQSQFEAVRVPMAKLYSVELLCSIVAVLAAAATARRSAATSRATLVLLLLRQSSAARRQRWWRCGALHQCRRCAPVPSLCALAIAKANTTAPPPTHSQQGKVVWRGGGDSGDGSQSAQ